MDGRKEQLSSSLEKQNFYKKTEKSEYELTRGTRIKFCQKLIRKYVKKNVSKESIIEKIVTKRRGGYFTKYGIDYDFAVELYKKIHLEEKGFIKSLSCDSKVNQNQMVY